MPMILGIDLGTTNSSAAFFDGRDITLIPNDRGSRTTPSVIALSENAEILVGESARNQAVLNSAHTIRNAKRLMGTGKQLNFGSRLLRPEDALSYILSSLKKDAENYLGQDIAEAVITVPAYFSEIQRRAVREAGRIAGFDVRRLLNEPTAAAIAWAWSAQRSLPTEETERTVLVYDLGGGTFDATVLSMKGANCKVLAASGDNALGGADFDALLLEHAIQVFEAGLGRGTLRSDPILSQQLAFLVEKAKIELSTRDQTVIVLPFAGLKRGVHPQWKLQRKDFEALIEPYIEKTVKLVQQALEEAQLRPSSIDHLVFSGGSSRIPLVRNRLSSLIGKNAEARVNPEEIVAHGASVFAALGEGQADGFTVQDAVSRSFGVEIEGDDFISLVAKNTSIPCRKTRAFTTVADDQKQVEIHILQGESKKASKNLSLGRFLLSGIRSGKRGDPRIEVEFSIDHDEILHVRARDMDTGVSQSVTVASSPEGAIPVSRSRLLALASRAHALVSYANGDRLLESELDEAVRMAQRAARGFDAEGGVPETVYADAENASMSLEAIVAELEARKNARE